MKAPAAIVFLGPSLPAEEALRLFPAAIVRGPAQHGDVLAAVRDRPRVIALIDGVFESQRSVWHQELRIALAEGISVMGASSMGALRAAELAPFGMIGVGAVYRAYAEGRLTDDADVALLHASAEHQHRALTVPFVNVVATVEGALDDGVVTMTEARAILRSARAIHYKDRHWPLIVSGVRWSDARKQRFEKHRRARPRDVKADDAREALAAARSICESAAPASPFVLPSISTWARRAWVAAQGEPPPGDGANGVRTLLLAEWARSTGLAPDPLRVASFAKQGGGLGLDTGVLRAFAEALALEEQILQQPGRLLAQAPSPEEGRWVDGLRTKRTRRAR